MEAIELAGRKFWESRVNHIARNPLESAAGRGLSVFARVDIGVEGWCFFQTSGTEGAPKWVGLPKAAFLESARHVNAHFQLGGDDVWAIALPLHHVGGFAITARACVSGARVAEFPWRWDAREFAAFCKREAVTVVSLVPTQVFDIVAAGLACPERLRTVIVGGGLLSPALAARARGLGWRVLKTYGMTEAASMVAAQSLEGDPADEAMLVLPQWEASVDEEQALTLKGPCLARGYATRCADGAWSWMEIDREAGLRTRDRAVLSGESGRQQLSFLGRESSFVKILGELVSLGALQERIEAAARDCGFTRRVVIASVPDERRESRLVLVIEGTRVAAAASESLIARYNAGALPFERIETVREIERLPLAAVGKVDMAGLAVLLR